MKKRLVVLSGAGMSQESGLQTFRDDDGLWRQYDVMKLATPEAWNENPQLVMDFYNKRRYQLYQAKPNKGHTLIALLQKNFEVQIITQNVDDLHERAGSENVLHLHGELKKVRSTKDPTLIYDWPTWELKLGDLCELGSQLRPHIVWFGEEVQNMNKAIKLVSQAEIVVVVGTSFLVYPASSLVYHAKPGVSVFVINPDESANPKGINNVTFINKKATDGMSHLYEILLKM